MLVALAGLCGPASAASAGSVAVRWQVADGKAAVEAIGLGAAELKSLRDAGWSTAQWQKLFPVYAEQGDVRADMTLPPMLGRYAVSGEAVRFEPQFPLDHAIKYRAVFRPEHLPNGAGKEAKMVAAAFQLPARSSEPVASVTQVYPTAAVLPENLLKFYLHFSHSMRRGEIYDHIHLLDDKGKEVELPFLQIDEELWNDSLTRLTLFIDPGRIKREVKPLEEIGPSLEAGKSFTLVIDRDWRDANGVRMKESFRRTFKVGPPDRESLDTKKWRVQAPKAGAREALELSFPKPVDHALALRVIHVANAAGETVGGDAALRDAERTWTFTPEGAWRKGAYEIVVQNTFEDLAGNNIGKPFEVDVFDGVQRRITNTFTKLKFETR